MVYANDFLGKTDSDVLEAAIKARGLDGIVVIPPRQLENEPERDFWLIDRAILLPENTTVILSNCKIKLSDSARDNFFRSANCGEGIEYPETVKNIHIKGEGSALLEGADYPRSTGDRSKKNYKVCPHFAEDICKYAPWLPEERKSPEKLTFDDFHDYSYGTDEGKEGESQQGDWRNVGVLLAHVENFSISNITIKYSHAWAISMESCAYGTVEKITFEAYMHRNIDGMEMNIENQDGVNLRTGCHHIVVSDIFGCTGDDVIAINASSKPWLPYRAGGTYTSTMVTGNDYSYREKDIHDVIVRNVIAHSYLCFTVRLLAMGEAEVYNVVIDGIVDTAPANDKSFGTFIIGDISEKGRKKAIRNVTISNVICSSQTGLLVHGHMSDSVISNVIHRNTNGKVIDLYYEDGFDNVVLNNVISE